MSIKNVDQAFDWFERNVARVDDEDIQDATEVHPEVRKAVCEALPVVHHFLSGSYGRHVQAVKLHDIDIIVVLEDADGEFLESAHGTLVAVKAAVSACDLVRYTRPPAVRSVKAFLHDYDFHVDIVPAIRPADGDGLRLTRHMPAKGLNDWTLEYPEQQLKACQDKNAATGGLFVPATRIVRAWNQRHSSSKPLRSYHAEALLYHGIGDAKTLQEAVVAFFDYAYEALAPGKLTATPGAPTSRYVDDLLSADDRLTARGKVEAARANAYAAAELDDPEAAMEAWVRVFGPAFPAPSTEPEAVGLALAVNSAVAVGAGLRSRPSVGGRALIQGRSWRTL